jgi:hypothetical protein
MPEKNTICPIVGKCYTVILESYFKWHPSLTYLNEHKVTIAWEKLMNQGSSTGGLAFTLPMNNAQTA